MPLRVSLVQLYVQLSGTVAALAADGVAAEDRFAETVDRILHSVGVVAVAGQALAVDRPFERERRRD